MAAPCCRRSDRARSARRLTCLLKARMCTIRPCGRATPFARAKSTLLAREPRAGASASIAASFPALSKAGADGPHTTADYCEQHRRLGWGNDGQGVERHGQATPAAETGWRRMLGQSLESQHGVGLSLLLGSVEGGYLGCLSHEARPGNDLHES